MYFQVRKDADAASEADAWWLLNESLYKHSPSLNGGFLVASLLWSIWSPPTVRLNLSADARRLALCDWRPTFQGGFWKMRPVIAQLDKQIKSGRNCELARGALLPFTPPTSLPSVLTFLPENSFPPFVVLRFALAHFPSVQLPSLYVSISFCSLACAGKLFL